MKNLKFVVEVNFEDHIYDDNEINEVASNILKGLVNQVNHEGITREQSETFTKSIYISNDGLEIANHIF